MKILKWDTGNIEKAIVGKVTHRMPLFSDKDGICITKKISSRANKCGALIYVGDRAESAKTTVPHVALNEQAVAEYMSDGDIVRINPNGTIIKLYDRTSEHNSLFVTSRCNCRCVMCPQLLASKDEMSPGEMVDFQINIIRMMDKNVKSIGITGGEPTLLGDELVRLVDACKTYLPDTALTILSNGIEFSRFEYAKKLAMVDHPDLLIAVALYADNDAEHEAVVRSKGAFYKTVRGLHNLALCRQKIEIRNVLNALTYERLPQFTEFIYRNFPFVAHVALMGMEMTEEAGVNADSLWVNPDLFVSKLQQAVLNLSRYGMNVSIYNIPLCILTSELGKFCSQAISDWKKAYLPICEECTYRTTCGGYFESSEPFLRPHLRPFKGE